MNKKQKLARIAELEKANAELRKEIKHPKESSEATPEEQKMMEHLWERCRAMESKEYWWFKQMSRVVMVFGKSMSPKQRESFLPIWEKYKDSRITPKPKDPKKLNPHA